MNISRKHRQYFLDVRHLHRKLLLVMFLPLLLAVITGAIYKIVDLEVKIMSSNRY